MLCVPSSKKAADLLSSFSFDPCAADILKLKCSEAFARILLLLQQQQEQMKKKKKMTTTMKKKTSSTNKKEFQQQKEEEEGEEEKAENTNSEEDKEEEKFDSEKKEEEEEEEEEEKEAIERCCFKNFNNEGRYLHCMFYNLAVLFTRCVKDNVSPLPFSVAAAAAATVGSHLDQEACLRKLLESAADTSCSSSYS